MYKARAFLKEFHAKTLREHQQPADVVDESETANADEGSMSPEPLEMVMESAEEAGSFSPQLLLHHVDGTEGAVALERKRKEVLEERRRRMQRAMAPKPAPSADDFEMKAIKAMGAMEEGDAAFGAGAEVNLGSPVCRWDDKYRPRKLKYFNRVHTGYEGNKYDQTHYDHDNPPPNIVQGYKFNVFYPNLIDKAKAPMYLIEKDGNSTETCIIQFRAGPPYEDIAIRIVHRDWEKSHKKGFKCTFERGSLHVYFNFKRYRYRR